jgi:IS5 family transposase
MRQERIMQASIFDIFAEHEIGRELKSMSDWLDEQRSLLGLVIGDLRRHGELGGDQSGCGEERTPPAAAA